MLKVFERLKYDAECGFNEDEINELGHRLLYDKKDLPSALEIFNLNAERFPNSYNVRDFLSEIFYQAGRTEEVIANYEKSLRLDPKNQGGRRMLERIKRGEKP